MRHLATLIAVLALAACSDAGFSNDRGTDDMGGAADDESDNLDEDPAEDRPQYLAIDGQLHMAEASVDLELSSVTITFFDAAGLPWRDDSMETDEEPAACDFGLLAAVEGPPRDAEATPLVAWWTLTLVSLDEEACPWSVPAPEALASSVEPQLVLGFGAVEQALKGPMAASGLDPELPVYGLYTLFPDGRGDAEWTFGIAGTADQRDGEDEASMDAPLAPGTYELSSLVLLPVP